jgi:hypothetical protein
MRDREKESVVVHTTTLVDSWARIRGGEYRSAGTER